MEKSEGQKDPKTKAETMAVVPGVYLWERQWRLRGELTDLTGLCLEITVMFNKTCRRADLSSEGAVNLRQEMNKNKLLPQAIVITSSVAFAQMSTYM